MAFDRGTTEAAIFQGYKKYVEDITGTALNNDLWEFLVRAECQRLEPSSIQNFTKPIVRAIVQRVIEYRDTPNAKETFMRGLTLVIPLALGSGVMRRGEIQMVKEPNLPDIMGLQAIDDNPYQGTWLGIERSTEPMFRPSVGQATFVSKPGTIVRYAAGSGPPAAEYRRREKAAAPDLPLIPSGERRYFSEE